MKMKECQKSREKQSGDQFRAVRRPPEWNTVVKEVWKELEVSEGETLKRMNMGGCKGESRVQLHSKKKV